MIRKEKFLVGLKYAAIAEVGLGVILFLIWVLATLSNPSPFPLDIFTLGSGGLLLLIAGCVGPGRYHKTYELILYTPKDGSSYSESFKVNGFVVDESIQSASVMVNSQKVGSITFKNFIGSTIIKREDIMEITLNKIWLESDSIKSNETVFSLFDYSEDMTDDEIEEFSNFELGTTDLPIHETRVKYIKFLNRSLGSISFGVLTVGLVTMILGALVGN
jgi:hypothetical protein